MIETRPLSIPIPTIRPRHNYSRRKLTNGFMLACTAILTILALAPLVWVVSYVLVKGSQFITPAFFTQLPRPLGVQGGGVLNAIEGTLILSLLAALFAIPPGILAAIYVSDHPDTPIGTAVRFSTDVLAGVPSIIVGLFGYALIVKPQGHYSALAGGLVLGIIMLPIIIRTTEEMIRLVPRSLREGSLALGAPEWKTKIRVILPAAMNGIITGILLGLARASGETAPLLFTALGNERYDAGQIISGGVRGGQGLLNIVNRIIEQPVDSLPLTLFKYSQQPYPERINQAWAAALVLMGIVLLLNISARLWVNYSRATLKGK
jgi:phosphate transport system permease protein